MEDDSHEVNTSDNEETNDYYTNPQKRKQYDIQKLQQQNKEILQMSGHNKKLAEAMIAQLNANKQVIHKKTKSFANISLCGCTLTNPFRDFIIQVVFHPCFERIILITILANCVVLMIENPGEEPDPLIQMIDFIFLGIFSVEMVLKIIAMGFFMQPYSYLRDAWNVLDFTVVILGWSSTFLADWNISAIRVIRILRPLRTLNNLQGMRGLVLTLINSLPSMINIFLLFFFTLIIFGTIGVQLFKGIFQFRCVLDSTMNEADFTLEEYLYNSDGEMLFCQTDGAHFECPDLYSCVQRGNPGVGLRNWDNIFLASLTQFELITLEGWTDIMYQTRNAYGGSAEFDIFFIISIVFGAFFVLNLMIAVQYNFLEDAFNDIAEQKEREKRQILMEIKENEQNQQRALQISEGNDGNQRTQNDQQKSAEEEETKKKCCDCDPEKHCCSAWFSLRKAMKAMVTSNSYTILIVILIVGNTVVLASEHYDQPEWLTVSQYYANMAFTVIFAVEMLIMIMALGLCGYLSDGFNIFDAVIVTLSLGEMWYLLQFTDGDATDNQGGFITVLRGFRLMRIFKLVRSWVTLQQILATVIKSIGAISNLAVLTFLFLFIYSLVGKQFFYGTIYDEDDQPSRYNFNSTFNSMITMFIVLTGENWNTILQQVVYSKPEHEIFAIVFFVSAMLICNFMLLNLFLAILLKFLQDVVIMEERQKKIEQELAKAQELSKKRALKYQSDLGKSGGSKQDEINFLKEKNDELGEKSDFINAIITNKVPPVPNSGAETEKSALRRQASILKPRGITTQQSAPKLAEKKKNVLFVENDEVLDDNKKADDSKSNNLDDGNLSEMFQAQSRQSNVSEDANSNLRRQSTDYLSQLNKTKVIRKTKRMTQIIVEGKSLCLFGEDNVFRLAVTSLIENPYFENFILALIGLNSLFLALEEPTLKDEYSLQTLALFGHIISGVFLMECVLKIFVMGFIGGKHAYLKDNYNVLDFVIVAFSIISMYFEYANVDIDISAVKAFRALRALRPLKLVSKNEGMKLLVSALLGSIPKLINVMLVAFLFYLVFGIIGLQLMAGKVSFCEEDMSLNKEECLAIGGAWTLPDNNYDNIFSAMTTFFEVSTLETWPEIMFAASDSQQEPDLAPDQDARWYLKILFIIFIFMTTFFIMNLFISVIVRQFNEQKQKSEGSSTLTDEQREWVKIQRFMAEVTPTVTKVMPIDPFRKLCYHIANSSRFEGFIIIMITLNTIVMCLDYYDASEVYLQVLDIFNLVFVAIFTAEAIIKLLGFGPTYYFYIDWNRFDFFVVVMSLFSLYESSNYNLTAIRIIRVARLLRMIKSSKELQSLLKTLYLALNNIANVGLLYMLIIFTFSVAGMALFGDIEVGKTGSINRNNVNFTNFYLSAMVLIRASTGESWNQIMHDCTEEKGLIAKSYWLVFQMLSFFIFLNVFIAVIYEEFQNVNQVESNFDVLSLKKRDIQTFLNTWAEFNQQGQHYMKTENFRDFLRRMPAPLGYKGLNIEKSRLDKIIYCLNIRDHESRVYFPEVMWAVFYSIIGKNDKGLHECRPMRNIMRKVKNKYNGLGRNTSLDMLCGNKFYRNEMTITKYLCGKVIFRNMMARRKKREEQSNENLKNIGTSMYLQQHANQKKQKQNVLADTWTAIFRKPEEMKIYEYKVPQRNDRM